MQMAARKLRVLVACALAVVACGISVRAQEAGAAAPAIAPGPFKPTMESLKGYRCPEWFRDAKFGIWAHWGPQAVPMIGDWYYNKDWKFRPVSWVVHMLADIVSKNGNLLLNVVQRPDGSLDPEVETMLGHMAAWMDVHGEAIYATRPWLVYGEGAVRAKGGHFGEDFAYTSGDIRFTTKGATLYAIALGWPKDGTLVVRSLAAPAGEDHGTIADVTLLGYTGKLAWMRTADGLVVTMPATTTSQIACALKITGANLTPAAVAYPVAVITPDAKGDVALLPDAAELEGGLKTEAQGGEPNIGFWDRAEDSASWKVKLPSAGTFQVSASCSTIFDGAEFVVDVSGQELAGTPARTGSWAEFRVLDLGRVQIAQGGVITVKVGSAEGKAWKAINLRWVKLTRAN